MKSSIVSSERSKLNAKEPGWIFQVLEWISQTFVFQEILLPTISWVVSFILWSFYGLYSLFLWTIRFALLTPGTFLVYGVLYATQGAVRVFGSGIARTLSLIPVNRRGLVVLSLALAISSGFAVKSFVPGEWTLPTISFETWPNSISSSLSTARTAVTSSLFSAISSVQSFVPKITKSPPITYNYTIAETQDTNERIKGLEEAFKSLADRISTLDAHILQKHDGLVKSLTASMDKKDLAISQELKKLVSEFNVKLQEAQKNVRGASTRMDGLDQSWKTELDKITKLLQKWEADAQKREKAQDQNAKAVDGLVAKVETLSKKVAELGRVDAPKSGMDQETVQDIIKDYLPQFLVARVDDQGSVELDPAFWGYLLSAFVTQESYNPGLDSQAVKGMIEEQVSQMIPRSDWEDIKAQFLAQNQANLMSVVSGQIKEHVKDHKLVTKEDVVRLVWNEWSGTNQGRPSNASSLSHLVKHWVQESEPLVQRKSRDYALWSTGGRILQQDTSPTYTPPYRSWVLRAGSAFFGVQRLAKRGPKTVLEDNLRPGECWPMQGKIVSLLTR